MRYFVDELVGISVGIYYGDCVGYFEGDSDGVILADKVGKSQWVFVGFVDCAIVECDADTERFGRICRHCNSEI